MTRIYLVVDALEALRKQAQRKQPAAGTLRSVTQGNAGDRSIAAVRQPPGFHP